MASAVKLRHLIVLFGVVLGEMGLRHSNNISQLEKRIRAVGQVI